MIKVLFYGLKNEYGNPARGVSFEYKHFYDVLRQMEGVECSFFPFDEIMHEVGREGMNRKLIKTVEREKPDLLFCFLFTEELKKNTIERISCNTQTKTFNWFGDDHWRFEIFSKFWAPLFTVVSTTDGLAYRKYKAYGINNVIKTQWGVNHFLFKPQENSNNNHNYNYNKNYDITFYGQNYGNRPSYIKALAKAGLPAKGWGRGWENGGSGTDAQEMLNIYSFSKINLNFTETPYVGFKKKLNLFAKLFVKKELGRYKLDIHRFIPNLKAAIGTQRRTIKARTFEVTACGGFLLTGKSDDDLSEYLIPGKEVEVFASTGELIEKCRYYLEHEAERAVIAKAGYERTMKEHTYVHRFNEIFKALGLK